MNMVAIAAQVCGIKPQFAQAAQPDLSGLIEHTYTTDEHLSLRCYLEHDEAVAGGGDAHPDTGAKVWLVYAFAGAADVFELVEMVPGLQAKIEAEALADLNGKAKDSHDEARIEAHIIRMECVA